MHTENESSSQSECEFLNDVHAKTYLIKNVKRRELHAQKKIRSLQKLLLHLKRRNQKAGTRDCVFVIS